MRAKTIGWMIVCLCVSGTAGAQEKIETPSQKTKDAVDKFNDAPAAVSHKLKEFGKSVGKKLGLGGSDAKLASSTKIPEPEVEAESEQAPAFGGSSASLRDPFRPFTIRPPGRTEPLTPLQRVELGQLKLVGIIWDTKEPNAIVEDSTGLGYVVRVGTLIGQNEGKVKAISPSGLFIEETMDDFGEKKKVERNMKLTAGKAE